MTDFLKFKNGVNLGRLSADPGVAEAGDIYFNDVSNEFRGYDGTQWLTILDTNDAANRSLSNLTSPTALNQDLLPDSSVARNLGSNSLSMNSVQAARFGGSDSVFTYTGDISNGSPTVNNMSSVVGLTTGMAVYGTGISAGTNITNIAGNTLTLSGNAGTNATGTSLSFTGFAILRTNDGTSGEISGSVAVRSGNVINANSGELFVRTGNATTTGNSGIAQFRSGNTGAGNSGAVSLTSGNSTAGGNSGTLVLQSGTSTTGSTGTLTLNSGNSTSGGATGGTTVTTGTTSGTVTGNTAIRTGNGLGTTSNTGTATIISGTVINGTSGLGSVASGAASGTGISGNATLVSGNTNSGVTGNVTVKSGNSTSGDSGFTLVQSGTTSGNSGVVQILSGSAGINSGEVQISTGNSSTSGLSGHMTFTTGDSAANQSGSFIFTSGTAATDRGSFIADVSSASITTVLGGNIFFPSDESLFIGGTSLDLGLKVVNTPSATIHGEANAGSWITQDSTNGNMNLVITAADGTVTDTPGKLTLASGDATANNDSGSAIAVMAGNGDGTGIGGDVVLTPGTGASPGNVVAEGQALVLSDAMPLRYMDADSSNYVSFQAPAVVATNVVYTLPDVDGASGDVLSTDGAGTLSWETPGAGSAGYTYHTFHISGTYGADTFWDGEPVIFGSSNIHDVFISNGVTGVSGTVTVDVLYATNQSTPVWTSVFTTPPTIDSTAASGSWCGISDTVTGHTAGVLTTSPLPVASKTAFRMDTQGTFSGFGDLTVTVVFGP